MLFSTVDNFGSNNLGLWFCKEIYELRKEINPKYNCVLDVS